jgi:hypothetical protein
MDEFQALKIFMKTLKMDKLLSVEFLRIFSLGVATGSAEGLQKIESKLTLFFPSSPMQFDKNMFLALENWLNSGGIERLKEWK